MDKYKSVVGKIDRARYTILALIGIVSFAACRYDSEDVLYPNNDCMSDDVRFSVDVRPLLENACLSCHNAVARQGDVVLDSHAAVLPYALDGSLVGSVRHDQGYVPMPIGGEKLDNCSIQKMDAWVKAGAPDN